jgi:phospholipid/cholesterol/gamma-HCH transport system substrate-binding protein
VEAIENRPGLLHTLIYGKKDKSGKDLENTLDKLDAAITSLDSLLNDIKNEEGVLTALIYDEKLREKLDSTLTNIDEVTVEINSEDGILPQLKETVSNFREISERLEGGEGTLGALINDPTVYDNLKGVLGEAERSRFVRAAVQYLIENQRKDTNQTQ